MTARKTPILLRRGPMSGEVMAIHNYTRTRGMIKAATDGKQSVQADFDVLALTELLDPDSPDIAECLDGAAKGMELNEDERRQVGAFRGRLVAMIERHNTKGHGVDSKT